MLPVVAGGRTTRLQMLGYAVLMAAVAVAPWPLGLASMGYGLVALALSLVFLALNIRVVIDNAATTPEMKGETRAVLLFDRLCAGDLRGACRRPRGDGMNDPLDDREFKRRRQQRAIVTAVLLAAMVALFYFITFARLGSVEA